MTEELVSVVIPFFSGADWLQEAVESVLNQTYKKVEIIVINDGSEEDLTQFLQRYGDDIIYIEQANAGAAVARNIGIDISKGQYVAFLDSDDLWVATKLEKQLAFMNKNNLVWSHTSYIKFGDTISDEIRNISSFKGDVFPKCLSFNPIATPTVMISNAALREDSRLRFAAEMKSGEDSILWLKLAKKFQLGVIEEPLARVRIRGSNAALRAYAQLRAKAQIWNKITRENLINKSKVKPLVRGAFLYCTGSYTLLAKIGKSEQNEYNRCLEYVARVLYLFPWLIFRSQR